VKLENEIAPGLNKLGLAWRQRFRHRARTVSRQEFARNTAANIVRIQGEWHAKGFIREPHRTRLTDADDDVMSVRTIARADFSETHPGVLLKTGRDDDVLIRHHTGSRDIERGRHFEDDFRPADCPALYPLEGNGRFRRIACRRA
jgi:hypothetical protein